MGVPKAVTLSMLMLKSKTNYKYMVATQEKVMELKNNSHLVMSKSHQSQFWDNVV